METQRPDDEMKKKLRNFSGPGSERLNFKMADDRKESAEQKCQIELNEKTQTQASSEEKNNSSSTTKKTRSKIDVLLKAAGDAPIMKKKKWAVDAHKTVAYLVEFIRKYIKCTPSDSLFLYVNQCFVPYPDQPIQNLYECFGTDGKLVLYYCKTQAWG